MTDTATPLVIPEETPQDGAAQQLARLVEPMFGGALPLRVKAWDGSVAGPADAPTVLVKSPNALTRLMWHPGELGMAQAYVTGEIDVEGDLLDGFRRMWKAVREQGASPKLRPGVVVEGIKAIKGLGAIGRPPVPPASQANLRGRLHTIGRDREAIAHHYDLSNDFYQFILDEHMAYSSAYFTSDAPDYTIEDAQRDKLELVCRKLDIQPGSRHLDIGCGWGSMVLYIAEHYDCQVVGVTISKEQKAFIDARIAERGLGDKLEVRLQDYRDVPDGPFDTVSSIEMGEHVGEKNYPVYVGQIHRLLREGGRMVIQQMSRTTKPGGGPFIEAFIAPDMHMRPVGETVNFIEQAGLEVRDVHAMREHYVRTVDAWYETFDANWDKVVEMVGEEVGRVWRLYLVGGALAFEENRMGVDQILGVKPSADGRSHMPWTRTWM